MIVGLDRVGEHHGRAPIARTATPASVSAARTARASAAAPGVSACRHNVSARTTMDVPVTVRIGLPQAMSHARCATSRASVSTAPGCVRGTSDPSSLYRAIDEAFLRCRKACAASGVNQHGCAEADQPQARIDESHRRRNGVGDRAIARGVVVERAVRLDVRDRGAALPWPATRGAGSAPRPSRRSLRARGSASAGQRLRDRDTRDARRSRDPETRQPGGSRASSRCPRRERRRRCSRRSPRRGLQARRLVPHPSRPRRRRH